MDASQYNMEQNNPELQAKLAELEHELEVSTAFSCCQNCLDPVACALAAEALRMECWS
jgi:hypothetical protein